MAAGPVAASADARKGGNHMFSTFAANYTVNLVWVLIVLACLALIVFIFSRVHR